MKSKEIAGICSENKRNTACGNAETLFSVTSGGIYLNGSGAEKSRKTSVMTNKSHQESKWVHLQINSDALPHTSCYLQTVSDKAYKTNIQRTFTRIGTLIVATIYLQLIQPPYVITSTIRFLLAAPQIYISCTLDFFSEPFS